LARRSVSQHSEEYFVLSGSKYVRRAPITADRDSCDLRMVSRSGQEEPPRDLLSLFIRNAGHLVGFV
jgi:hypothetical protein